MKRFCFAPSWLFHIVNCKAISSVKRWTICGLHTQQYPTSAWDKSCLIFQGKKLLYIRSLIQRSKSNANSYRFLSFWKTLSRAFQPSSSSTAHPNFVKTIPTTDLLQAYLYTNSFFRIQPSDPCNVPFSIPSPPLPLHPNAWTVGQDVEVYWNSYWSVFRPF